MIPRISPGKTWEGFGGAIVSLVPDVFLPMGAYDALSTDFTKDGMVTTLADPRHFNLVLEGQLLPGATIESVNPLLKATSAKMVVAELAAVTEFTKVIEPSEFVVS